VEKDGSETNPWGFLSSGAEERFATWCLPVVIVMQAAQHGERDDLSARQRLIFSLWLAA